jgi:hypothetical protein
MRFVTPECINWKKVERYIIEVLCILLFPPQIRILRIWEDHFSLHNLYRVEFIFESRTPPGKNSWIHACILYKTNKDGANLWL